MSAIKFPGAALVTGAAGGIGAAIALAFADAGCTRIAITDISASGLDIVRQQIVAKGPVNVFLKAGDISSEEFVDSFINQAHDSFGRLDYVVNCAGVMLNDFARSTDVSAKQFDFVNGVNYRGTWLVSRAALKKMLAQDPVADDPAETWRAKSRGSVVNIASQLGVVSRPGASAYCASKAAIIGLTRADAIDFSKDLIRVNCVCPGVIETALTTSTPERVEAIGPAVQIAPMGRMGDPREVADAVLFLSSSKASFVQGHALVVDGGYVIN
ncbi:SDR family NAD(P)-dependent oxidoreductase [Aspergillus stella-maris]|uniref:SDR family NAD(P)-dependent oxidoreductase n=1 Tax=Aspergillus stella-maris TaxID=1810926 RepID=UPI003CCD8A4B